MSDIHELSRRATRVYFASGLMAVLTASTAEFAAALSDQIQPFFGFWTFALRRYRRTTAGDLMPISFPKSRAVYAFVEGDCLLAGAFGAAAVL